MPQETFSDHILDHPLKSDATELRKEVQKWVKSGMGQIKSSTVVACRPGTPVTSHSVYDYIYSTESDPPEMPNQVNLTSSGEHNALIIPPTATAFETRKLGTSLKVLATLSKDRETIKLEINPEMDRHVSDTDWPTNAKDKLLTISMPKFRTMKTTTRTTLTSGEYQIVGTHRFPKEDDPNHKKKIALQFVRADIATIQ